MEKDNFLGRWISGDLSDEEKETFEKSNDYLAYTDILNNVEKFDRPVFDIEKGLKAQKEFNKIYQKPTKSKVITLRPWLYSAAAILVVLIGIRTLFFTTTKVSTTIAETKSWTLPDSSVVTLNADSTIEYDEDSFTENRSINLIGEAFFDVAKGSSFTVKTKNGDVTVLGTEFNVYSRDQKIEVHCFEGKVRVNHKKEAVILTPGKGVKSTKTGLLSSLETNNPGPNWMKGKSDFNKVTLAQLIAELERQYGITINTIAIDTNRLFSGFFTHNDLNKALKTCFEPMNISYKFKNPTNIELKNK